jgi:hypothetical protein
MLRHWSGLVMSLSFGVLAACQTGPGGPGHASGTAPIGPADAPRVAEVFGRPVHANDAAQARHLILRELTDRYASDLGLAATSAEVQAWLDGMQRARQTDPALRGSAGPTPDTRSAYAEAARAFILQRKVDGALQREYGGRIALLPGAAVPVDAYRRFLEDQAALGRFRILDIANVREFWRPYTDDSTYRFAAPDSEQARRAFDLPAASR